MRRSATGQTQQRKTLPLSVGPLRATVEQRQGVMIVTPVGTLQDPLPAGLVDQLETLVAKAPVIVDLSQITLVSPAPVMGLAAWLVGASHQPDRCCLVCPRATARALLRIWHITHCLATFGTIGDALQARRFHEEGYGAGWHPAPLARGTTGVPANPLSDPNKTGREGRMSDDADPFRAELLRVEVHYEDSDATLVLEGEFDSTGVEEFIACVVDALEAYPESLAIDTHGLTFADSSGLTALVRARAAAGTAGVAFRIRGRSLGLQRAITHAGIADLLGDSRRESLSG